MQDSIFIWKFLVGEYPDNHPVIYLYSRENIRSPITAVKEVMDITKQVFSPPISEAYLLSVVKGFLEMKKKQYMKGEITIKGIY